MKFSWKLINYFINLNENNLINLENQLTLSGIEIENIKNCSEDNDKVIELSITSNRKDIASALSLAIEISILTKSKLKVHPIRLVYEQNNIRKYKKRVQYTRVHVIYQTTKIKTPNWLLKELTKQDIKHENVLVNIQKYIQTKWGKTFKIISTENKSEIEKLQKKINYLNNIKYNSQLILLTFSTTYTLEEGNPIIYNYEAFFENLYIDSIQLISTILKTTISKYYTFYKELITSDININVKKSRINQFLGNTDEHNFKFPRVNDVQKILEQLQLYSIYNRHNKSFKIKIPEHRSDDLRREIDIIEEIGRIYRFQNFFNAISTQKDVGAKIHQSTKLKKIRNALRHLGLNEVVNCCLTTNEYEKQNIIKIHNPVNKEQPELRLNIVDNLIKNYKNNLKYTENSIEIFEIGKVFQKLHTDEKVIYIEQQSLGVLIYNDKYYREDWSKKSNKITFFQAKGILENFLENINANTRLERFIPSKNYYGIKSLTSILRKDHQIGIYNKESNKLIGIFGELKPSFVYGEEKKDKNLFIFEINLKDLIKSINKTNHLNYLHKPYSKYPCVTRDISIKIEKSTDIDKVKERIIEKCQSFIESINIFNEYTNNKTERFVGIRATYRAQDKTLSKNDIQILENNLQKVAEDLRSK